MNIPVIRQSLSDMVAEYERFLKPDGLLISIMPVTALTDHNFIDRRQWHDLPIGSFKESGTNINTGFAIFGAD